MSSMGQETRQQRRRAAQKKLPPPRPSFFERVKSSLEAAGYGQTAIGLLPASAVAGLVTCVGYLLDYGPFALILTFLGVFALVEFILWRATVRGWRIAALTLLLFVVVAGTAYAIYLRYQLDRAYELTTGRIIVLRTGETLPDGSGQVTGVNLGIEVKNESKDTIYYQVERRFGSIAGRASSVFDDANGDTQVLRSGFAFDCYSDWVPARLANNAYHEGQTECSVLYGKRPDKMTKRLTYRGNVRFFLCPVSGNICGPVESDGEPRTEWLDRR